MTTLEIAKEYMRSDIRQRGVAALHEYYKLYVKFFKKPDGTATLPQGIVEFLEELEEIANKMEEQAQ